MRKVAVVTLCAVLLASCATGTGEPAGRSPGAAAEPSVTIRLVIPDGNIREPADSCTGAGAFRFAHPETAYVIEDAAGEPQASGKLPNGRAERAWNLDLGDGRQPTVCVMRIEVAGLASAGGHSLVIGDRQPRPVVPNSNLDDIPEVVLS